MARSQMRGLVVDRSGNVLASQTVYIYQPGTTTATTDTLYATRTGSTTLSNPLTTDSNGYATFWVNWPPTYPVVRIYNATLPIDIEEQILPLGSAVVGCLTSVVTVSASTTQSTVLSYSIPANSVAAGSTFRCTMWGRTTVPSDASPTGFPIRFRVGGTTLVTATITPPATTVQTDLGFHAEFITTVGSIATPAAATLLTMGKVIGESGTTVATVVDIQYDASADVFDSTSAATMLMDVACGEATSGYIIKATHATIEQVQ